MKFHSFYFKYSIQQQTYYIEDTIFKTHENEHVCIEFLIDDSNELIYSTIVTPKQEITIEAFHIQIKEDYTTHKGIFCNGFQSWTESKVFYNGQTIKPAWRIAKGIAYTYGDYNFYNYAKQQNIFHSWSYTYIKLEKQQIKLYASLNEELGYTSFTHNINKQELIIKKDITAKTIEVPTTICKLILVVAREQEAFQTYKKVKHYQPLKVVPSIGWTSWYNYYTKISEAIILANLTNFVERKIPISIFQIDDGYQNAVGDWLTIKPSFPNGMQPIAKAIQQHNMIAGIWLAPFACEQNSFIYKEKPHWILRDENNKVVKIGYNPLWSGWFYALDFFNEEVKEYLRKVFDIILNEWGFDLVKLDFLYGVAAIPQHGKSRGEVMHLVMQFLRTCVGNKKILGCGVPLSAAENTTDFCRIGPDIHLSWEYKILKFINARERLSTYSAIHNTISRRQLNGLGFINDPDVFMLRKTNNQLNKHEQYSLLLANLLFGDLLFNSDDISTYDGETLFLYQSIFPLVTKENVIVQQEEDFYQIHFSIKDNYYLALFNLSNQDKIYHLPNGNFFDNQTQTTLLGNKRITLQKHSSKCLFRINATPFALVGSKGHFFVGMEIDTIYISNNSLEIEWNQQMLNTSEISYRFPKNYTIEFPQNVVILNREEDENFVTIQLQQA